MNKKCAKCGTGRNQNTIPEFCYVASGGSTTNLKMHQWVEEEPQKAEGCDCADKSCMEECSQDHTHKMFLCDKCHLDACQKEADERPFWLDDFKDRFYSEVVPTLKLREESLANPGFSEQSYLNNWITDYIQKTLSESLRRAAERVKGLKNIGDVLKDPAFTVAIDMAAESIIKDNEQIK